AVRDAELRTSIKAPATIEPVSGGEAVVSAPAAGRFIAQELISIGATVRAGQPLGRLEPRLGGTDDRATLSAELAQAQVAHEGAPLFKIVRTDEVELRVQVPAADAAAARSLTEVAFEIPGIADPMPLKAGHKHDPGVIDPKTGALPVQYEVDNSKGQLLIGQ